MNKMLVWVVSGVVVVGGGTAAGLLIADRSTNNSTDSVASTVSAYEPLQAQQRTNQSNCLADTCLRIPNLNYPVASLPSSVQSALSKSLDNEYKLQAYYQAVINKYGDKRPFAMIVGAETQHIAVITALYEKYGITPESNTWSDKSFSLDSFTNACQTAASYERDSVNLYDSLLPQVSSYSDISQVFGNIKEAASSSHVPAFDKCS